MDYEHYYIIKIKYYLIRDVINLYKYIYLILNYETKKYG